jgi:lysozyme
MTDRTRTAYFDALRAFAPDGHIGTDDFRMLDSVARKWGLPEDPALKTQIVIPSARAVALIQQFEGCAKKRPDGALDAYPDPGTGGDPWTIGWGSTGPDIHKGTVWTQAQADQRFKDDLYAFAAKVAGLVDGAATSQNEFDALCSLAYNIGLGNLASSTLLRLHKAGDKAGAAEQFARWDKAAGRVMAGLTRRRAAEADLYRGKLS